jgi:hypothetical protein
MDFNSCIQILLRHLGFQSHIKNGKLNILGDDMNIQQKPCSVSVFSERRWGKIDLTVVQEETDSRYACAFELRKLLHNRTRLCVQLKGNECGQEPPVMLSVGNDGDCLVRFDPTSDPAVVISGSGGDSVVSLIKQLKTQKGVAKAPGP